MTYLLGSGFHGSNEANRFYCQWVCNLTENIRMVPIRFIILSTTSAPPEFVKHGFLNSKWPSLPEVIETGVNPGHIGSLLNGSSKWHLCGWSCAVLTLAMLAYSSGLDFAFIEQDVLIKGDVITQMYTDLGDKKMIFGGKMETAPHQPCSQSVFLIKHDFLLSFIHAYIGQGTDNSWSCMPEHKFHRISELFPGQIAHHSYHNDRQRPIQWEQPVFHYQKITPEELLEFEKLGLL